MCNFIESDRNVRELASFVLRALKAVQYQTTYYDFVPKDYEFWSWSIPSMDTCCELVTRNAVSS